MVELQLNYHNSQKPDVESPVAIQMRQLLETSIRADNAIHAKEDILGVGNFLSNLPDHLASQRTLEILNAGSFAVDQLSKIEFNRLTMDEGFLLQTQVGMLVGASIFLLKNNVNCPIDVDAVLPGAENALWKLAQQTGEPPRLTDRLFVSDNSYRFTSDKTVLNNAIGSTHEVHRETIFKVSFAEALKHEQNLIDALLDGTKENINDGRFPDLIKKIQACYSPMIVAIGVVKQHVPDEYFRSLAQFFMPYRVKGSLTYQSGSTMIGSAMIDRFLGIADLNDKVYQAYLNQTLSAVRGEHKMAYAEIDQTLGPQSVVEKLFDMDVDCRQREAGLDAVRGLIGTILKFRGPHLKRVEASKELGNSGSGHNIDIPGYLFEKTKQRLKQLQ